MKTKHTLKYTLLLCAGLWISLTGCDDFLDINDDPNNPTEGAVSLLLPSAQVDIGGALGNSMGGLSAIPQAYMHQMFERGTTQGDYGVNGSDFEVITPWNILYTRALMDIEQIISQGTDLEAWSYVGVAQIMKAYSLSLMVDMYGDVPFSEAFQGTALVSPFYDDDEVVYNELFLLLDQGIENLNKVSSITMGTDDLFYGGNLGQWQRFAKTVKLKMYTQIRLVRDVSTEVNALLAENDLISSSADDFQFVFGTSTGPENRNSAYVQEYSPGAARYYINPFFYETLAGLNTFGHRGYGEGLGLVDPRIPYYFYNQIDTIRASTAPENPCSYCYGYNDPGTGNFVVQVPELAETGMVSIYMFSFNIDPNEGFAQGTSQSVAGLYPLGGAFDTGPGSAAANFNGSPTVPQRFLTYYSLKYLEAELYLTGVATGNDEQAFRDALQASFSKVNEIATGANATPPIPTIPLTDGDEEVNDIEDYIDAVMADYVTQDEQGKLEHIMTQKWIASYGFACDTYTDYRRTGFPVLHDGNTDNLSVTTQVRDFPFAFPWVDANLEINANAPPQKLIATDNARIFWDPN